MILNHCKLVLIRSTRGKKVPWGTDAHYHSSIFDDFLAWPFNWNLTELHGWPADVDRSHIAEIYVISEFVPEFMSSSNICHSHFFMWITSVLTTHSPFIFLVTIANYIRKHNWKLSPPAPLKLLFFFKCLIIHPHNSVYMQH